jgi:hypothetical protein
MRFYKGWNVPFFVHPSELDDPSLLPYSFDLQSLPSYAWKIQSAIPWSVSFDRPSIMISESGLTVEPHHQI